MDFVLSDESLNEYGYRILTSGIDVADFERNPVMLYAHGTDPESRFIPIGRWENIRVENRRLLATAVFDNEDEFAQKIKSKIEQGILNACSIGFDILETSSDEDLIVLGQTRPTVVRSRIFEASVVPLPGNKNALKLRFPKKGLTLSAKSDERYLDDTLPKLKSKKMHSKKLALLMALATALEFDVENANTEEVLGKVTALKEKNELQKQKLSDALLEIGKQKGVVTEDNENQYKALAQSNFDATLGLITSTKVKKQEERDNSAGSKIAEYLRRKSNGGHDNHDNRDNWTFDEWSRKDSKGLLEIKRTDPKRYAELVKSYVPS